MKISILLKIDCNLAAGFSYASKKVLKEPTNKESILKLNIERVGMFIFIVKLSFPN